VKSLTKNIEYRIFTMIYIFLFFFQSQPKFNHIFTGILQPSYLHFKLSATVWA